MIDYVKIFSAAFNNADFCRLLVNKTKLTQYPGDIQRIFYLACEAMVKTGNVNLENAWDLYNRSVDFMVKNKLPTEITEEIYDEMYEYHYKNLGIKFTALEIFREVYYNTTDINSARAELNKLFL